MKNKIKTLLTLALFSAVASISLATPNDVQVIQRDSINGQFSYDVAHSSTKQQLTIWDAPSTSEVAHDLATGSVTTNSSGIATVTFPATFTSTPKVIVTPIDNTANTGYLFSVQKTTGGFTIQAYKLTTVLGILTFTTAASGVTFDYWAFVQ